jgi:hypothetical protein
MSMILFHYLRFTWHCWAEWNVVQHGYEWLCRAR